MCCAVNLFGAVDLQELNRLTQIDIDTIPNFRWKTLAEAHGGMLLGGDPATMHERGYAASPIHFISENTAPLAIFQGDQDPAVPCSMSEDFYQRLVDAGLEDQSELYIIKNGGHGTREIFQPEVKQRMADFFDRYMK